MKILIEDKKLLYSKNKVRSINDEIDRIIHLLYEIKSIVGKKKLLIWDNKVFYKENITYENFRWRNRISDRW